MIVPGLLKIAQDTVTRLERATGNANDTARLAATSVTYHAAVRALPRSVAVLLAVLAGQNPDGELTEQDLGLASLFAGAMLGQIRQDAAAEARRAAQLAAADRLGASRLTPVVTR